MTAPPVPEAKRAGRTGIELMHPEREASLKALGFRTYAEYLASPMWERIRENVLTKARFVCACCGERATQIHHRSYDFLTMRGSAPKNLTPVCRRCHTAMEFDGERKVELEEANARGERFAKPEKFVTEPKPVVIPRVKLTENVLAFLGRDHGGVIQRPVAKRLGFGRRKFKVMQLVGKTVTVPALREVGVPNEMIRGLTAA
jgi:hypothetical protein